MSRWVSLNQARVKASWKAFGSAWKRREIFSWARSKRIARSAVVIIGWWNFVGSWASTTVPWPASPFGFHWCAPAGDFVSSHSYPNRVSK
jgi:hypothetical protein